MDAKLNAAVKQALAGVKSGMTSIEKAMVLHDYLVEKITYTYSRNNDSNVYTAYGALVEGKAVCHGYTLAYNYLLKQASVGISSKFVPSKAMNHAWSLVSIGGKWYHVDVTWDDPDVYGRFFHDNFLISDTVRRSEIQERGLTPLWDIATSTGSAYDDHYWASVTTKFNYNSGKWYFSLPNPDTASELYCSKMGLDTNNGDDLDIIKELPGMCITKSGSDYFYCNETGIYKDNNGEETLLHEAGYSVLGFVIVGEQVKYSYYVNNSTIKHASFLLNKTTPTLRTAKAAAYNQIKLTWSACAGDAKADTYEILRSTDGKSFTRLATKGFTTTSYTDSSVKTGQTYYYKIRRTGTQADSGVLKAKTLPTTTKLTSIKATAYNKAALKWSKSSGAKGYTVYRAASAKGSYKAIKHTTATSYTNSGLNTGSTYYYKVRPYSLVGKTKVYGSYSGAKSVKPKLSATAKASVKKTGKKKVKLTWKKVAGASGYEVYKSTKKSSGYKKIKTTKSTSYTYGKCTTKKRNYFRVRAYRTVKGKKVYSGYRTVSIKM